jgi:hypothetical protein
MDVRTIARLLSSEIRPPNVENRAAGGTPVRQTPFDAIAQGLGRSAVNAVTYPGNYMQSYQPGQSVRDDPSATEWAGEMALNMVGSPALAGGLPGTVGSGVKALPMDNASRMARAQEQGYTVDAYKGMYPYDPATVPMVNGMGKVIDLPGNRNLVPKELTTIDSPSSPYAGFFSDDVDVANRFGDLYRGSVMPSKLKFENPLVIDAKGKPAAAFQFDSIAREHGTMDDMRSFRGAFEKGGQYDGVILKNTADEGTVYVPRNSDQVRSRFAKFDPANIKSGELLGGLGATAFVGAASRDDK